MTSKIHNLLLLFSFLLFPVTLNYLSPYLSMWGASMGIISGSLVVFGFMFVTSLFVGRLWCSTLCPASGFQNYLETYQHKRVKVSKKDWIKYGIWIAWFGSIVMMLVSSSTRQIDMLFMTEEVISVSRVGAYIIYYGVIGLVLLLNLTLGSRAFCHYGCWMAPFMVIGRKLSIWTRLPRFQLINTDQCISCKKCSTSCPMGIDVMSNVHESKMEHTECILCGNCIDACPKDVISYHIGR